MTDCLFCKVFHKKIEASITYEDDEIMAFEDINPQAPIHQLIIPKKHIETLNELSIKDADIMGKMTMVAKNLAKDYDIADSGYRLVMNCNRGAGQSVFHIHLHLLGGRSMLWPPG